MSLNSAIEWTHHTWNPWWGCTKISPGCANCYAARDARRYGFNIWGSAAERRFFRPKHWHQPIQWNKAAREAGQRHRVFPSMCDPFEDRDDLVGPLGLFLHVIRSTPNLDWLLVTKRPENIGVRLSLALNDLMRSPNPDHHKTGSWVDDWIDARIPPRNVWLLASVESQDFLPRADELLKIPAVVHGLSIEPMLGPIELDLWSPEAWNGPGIRRGLDWIICGGESGPGARPMHPGWARSLRDQCAESGVPFFFKQWGEWLPYEQSTTPSFWDGQDGSYADGHLFPENLIDGDPVKGWWSPDPADTIVYRKAGKAAAGSLLDGKEHKEFPTIPVIQ